jgi:hypothetical protein
MHRVDWTSRFLASIVLAAVVVLASSCGGGPAQGGKVLGKAVEIRPLRYQTTHQGDGWNVGALELYVINTSDTTVERFEISLEDAKVETEQGKSYPVELFSHRERLLSGGFDPFEDGWEIGWGKEIVLARDKRFPLVPGFPIEAKYPKGGHYVLGFRFATAATPTTVELVTSKGVVSLDLSEAEDELPQPDTDAESLAAFADFLSRDNDGFRVVVEDECTCDSNGKCSMPFTVKNKDELDEATFSVATFDVDSQTWAGGYALYFPDGGVRNRNTWPVIKETVGPGQTLEDTFDICQFVDFPPEYLIYYDTLTTERVYKVTCSQK